MSGNSVETMQDVVGEISRLIDGTTTEQLQDKTPCTEWTVKDLLAHLIGGAGLFTDVFEGREPDMTPPALPDDIAGVKAAWATNSTRVLAAFHAPGALERTALFPWGEMPGIAAVNLAVFDVTTHATDLATATGQPVPPEALLEEALVVGKQLIGPEMRVPGLFDPEQPAAEDAPAADRLLAFAGRRV